MLRGTHRVINESMYTQCKTQPISSSHLSIYLPLRSNLTEFHVGRRSPQIIPIGIPAVCFFEFFNRWTNFHEI